MHAKTFTPLLMVTFFAVQPSAANQIVGTHAPQLRFEKTLQGPAVTKLPGAIAGKMVILEFWATWCAPCVAAIPHMNALAEKAPAKVVFIAVTDEPEERVRRFLAKRKIAAWIALDSDRSVSSAFDVRTLPTTIVIEPSGFISMVTLPTRLTDQKIRELLREKQPSATVPSSRAESAIAPPPPIFQIEIAPSDGREDLYSFSPKKGIFMADAVRVQTLFGLANELSATRVIGPPSVLNQWVSLKCLVPADHDMLDVLRQALTTALAVRTHREVREITVYRLRIGPSGAFGIHAPDTNERGHLSTDVGEILAVNWDISSLSRELENVVGAPVLDETKLAGEYDWDLEFHSDKPADLAASLRDQLGLDLVQSTAAVEILVVQPSTVSTK